MTENNTELTQTFDYYQFETRMRKLVEDAFVPLQNIMNHNRTHIQYLEANVQNIASKIDDIERQSEKAHK